MEGGKALGFSFLCVHAQLWPARLYGLLNLGVAKHHSLELSHLRIIARKGLESVLGAIQRENRVVTLTQ